MDLVTFDDDDEPLRAPAEPDRVLQDKRRRGPLIVVVIIVSVAVGGLAGWRLHPDQRPARPPTSAPPRGSAATASPARDLRLFFAHTSSDGALVIARGGMVSTAAAAQCPNVPVPSGGQTSTCTNSIAPGVEFDFTAPGEPWYRLTLLADTSKVRRALDPQSFAGATERVDNAGATSLDDNPRVQLAVLRVGPAITRVRIALTDGRTDEAAPVDGWVAFPVRQRGATPQFVMSETAVQGFDASGRLIASSFPLRCC